MWKALKNIWREIKPNALWDLVKYMLIAGISFPVLYGYRVLAFVRELPQDRVVDAAIFIAAFILITCAMALTRYRDNQVLRKMLGPVLEQAERTLATTNTDEKSTPQPPSERIFVNVGPEYLSKFFLQHTDIQAARLIEPYIGKWMKVLGVVKDVSKVTKETVVVMERSSETDSLIVFAYFSDPKWVERVVLLRRDDVLVVIGRISRVTLTSIYLNFCETGGDDTAE